jgi:hypothetical protein
MTETEALATLVEVLDACRDDPVAFNDVWLNRPAYWSRQEEICRSVVRHRTTVVYTGNMCGKDYVVGGVIPWWLSTRPDSLVICTGPSQTVLGSVTWREVRRALEGAVVPWGGRISHAIKASPALVEVLPGWHALGYSTTSVERASGQHSGHLLVIVEEASGVPDETWDAIDSLGYERLLVIGNPIRAEGRFVQLIRQADADRRDGIPEAERVNAIRIPSTESPHASWDKSPVGLADRPWIEGMIRKYGPNSLWVRSHIKAEIPELSAETLIPQGWLDFLYAQTPAPRPYAHPINATRRIAVDLAEGVGRDATTVLVRDDWGVLDCTVSSALGLPEAAALVARKARDFAVDHARISYDKLGIGRQFPSYLARWGIQNAVPYAGEASPSDRDAFVNLRSEAAWRLRNRLDQRYCPDVRDPHKAQLPFTFAAGAYRDRLREELKPLTYSLVGKATKLLPKLEHCAALSHSPDVCDALVQSFAW